MDEKKSGSVEKCYSFESWKQKGGGEAGKSTERKIINNDELLASSLHSLAELWFIIRDGRGERFWVSVIGDRLRSMNE